MNPVEPGRWIDKANGLNKDELRVSGDPIGRKIIIDNFTERFAIIMWQSVTQGEAAGGLEDNAAPSLEPAKQCHKWVIRQGRPQQT